MISLILARRLTANTMAVAVLDLGGYHQPQANKQWLHETFHSMQRCGWLIGVNMATRFVTSQLRHTLISSHAACSYLVRPISGHGCSRRPGGSKD